MGTGSEHWDYYETFKTLVQNSESENLTILRNFEDILTGILSFF